MSGVTTGNIDNSGEANIAGRDVNKTQGGNYVNVDSVQGEILNRVMQLGDRTTSIENKIDKVIEQDRCIEKKINKHDTLLIIYGIALLVELGLTLAHMTLGWW